MTFVKVTIEQTMSMYLREQVLFIDHNCFFFVGCIPVIQFKIHCAIPIVKIKSKLIYFYVNMNYM